MINEVKQIGHKKFWGTHIKKIFHTSFLQTYLQVIKDYGKQEGFRNYSHEFSLNHVGFEMILESPSVNIK